MTAKPSTILRSDDYCTIYTKGPVGWSGRKVSRIDVIRIDRGGRIDYEVTFRLFRGAKPCRITVHGLDLVVVRGHWPEQPAHSATGVTFDRWLAGKSALLDARRA